MRVNRGDQTHSILILFKHKLNCLWGRTLSPCNTVCVQTQGFLCVGKDCGITAWMLNSFIIFTMSKHHFMPQEDSLIKVINIILPGTWGSRCARPGSHRLLQAQRREGHCWQQSYSSKKAARARGHLPCPLPGVRSRTWIPAVAQPWLTPSASVRNTLLVEGDDRVFPVEISKPNSGNLCYSHITRSHTDCQCPHTRKI